MKIMTQEDKELLLKDLSSRLPYGVLCEDMEGKMRQLFGITPTQHFIITLDNATDGTNGLKFCTIDCVKPYLRPMSSMTKEENKRYYDLCDTAEVGFYEFGELFTGFNNYDTVESIVYLNSIHVDYRGLIPKGLAIEVTKENNPYKKIKY